MVDKTVDNVDYFFPVGLKGSRIEIVISDEISPHDRRFLGKMIEEYIIYLANRVHIPYHEATVVTFFPEVDFEAEWREVMGEDNGDGQEES
jgi:hypothetical protein